MEGPKVSIDTDKRFPLSPRFPGDFPVFSRASVTSCSHTPPSTSSRHTRTNTLYRVALAFQNLTPLEVCAAFERALGRPVRYVHDLNIEIRVPIPSGYREQLAGIEELFGRHNAPYFPGPDFEYPDENSRRDSSSRPEGGKPQGLQQGNGDRASSSGGSRVRPRKLTSEARRLWPGFRRIEDYAREAFPIEEEANGKTWMKDKSIST